MNQRSELIKIAADMLMGVRMPHTVIEDWHLPKTTPKTALHKIEAAACMAEDQCKKWAIRLRQIADSL